MKAVMLTKAGDYKAGKLGELECCDIPMPELKTQEDVLIKVAYSSICGSDPNMLNGLMDCVPPAGFGHEMAGTIVELGTEAIKKGLKVGDKVTGNFVRFCGACNECRTGREQFCTKAVQNIVPTQAEYVLWNQAQVYKLQDDADLLTAALTEPLAIAVHAVEKGQIKLGNHVAVSGAGGIGLMIVQLAKMAGAAKVTVLEPVEEKRTLALSLGADYVIDAASPDCIEQAMELTNGQGFQVVYEASGNVRAARTALEIADNMAHIVYFSMYPPTFELPLNLYKYCYHKEINIHGMFLATYSFVPAINMLPRMNLRPLVQKIYALQDCKQAYKDHMSGQYAKIVFDCSAE